VSSGRITISRDRDLYGMARKYRIVIDGHEVARVANGQELTVPVAPGRHLVRVRLNRSHSNELQLDLEADTEARVRVRRAGSGWTKFLFGRHWPRPPIVVALESCDA
jgi:hypothetical protein